MFCSAVIVLGIVPVKPLMAAAKIFKASKPATSSRNVPDNPFCADTNRGM